tara:strand:+ start:30303 stop:30455 length:153 start_codon:yes stop_codon:yes gene_type:complete
MNETKNINLRDIPEKLHSDFKQACEKDGRAMRWVIMKMMERYIEKAMQGQ